MIRWKEWCRKGLIIEKGGLDRGVVERKTIFRGLKFFGKVLAMVGGFCEGHGHLKIFYRNVALTLGALFYEKSCRSVPDL